MGFPRRSGLLLHPTSLPGRYGIGDMGREAREFVDWLSEARQSYWQVLPICPTGYGDSPYQGISAFAGNPLLLSPDELAEAGFLSRQDLAHIPQFPKGRVDFGWLIPWKTKLLDTAFARFQAQATPSQLESFDRFVESEAYWLEDAALFLALKEANHQTAWYDWAPELKRRDPSALDQFSRKHADAIRRHKFWQWQFFEQWDALKEYANSRGIEIIGDIPIYVARDCCDVWANPGYFHLDAELNPTAVSGVPPDYFSATGQLWGHPLFRWDVMEQDGFRWWIQRLRWSFTCADVIRIDHFRGFHNYWVVPAGEETAVNGAWLYGPGATLFHAVIAALGPVRIIAEDLGDLSKKDRAELDALLREFDFPGMKVLQFAFGSDARDPFLPHNYTREWVVYTGTHDNDTVRGWWENSGTDAERAYARKYLATDGSDIAWDLIRAAWASVANTAMTTAQDILSLGSEARMNLPATTGAPNWCWRLTSSLEPALGARLRELTEIYGRIELPPEDEPLESRGVEQEESDKSG